MKPRQHHRAFAALLILLSLWGLAGWWPRLAVGAPDWTRLIPMPAGLFAASLWWVFYARGRRTGQRFLMALVLAGLIAGFWQDTGGTRRSIGEPGSSTFRLEQWTIASRTPRASILWALDTDSPHIRVLNIPQGVEFDQELLQRARLRGGIRDGNTYIFSRYPMKRRTSPQLSDAHAFAVSFDTADGRIDLLALDADRGVSPADMDTLRDWLNSRDKGVPLILSLNSRRGATDAMWQPLRSSLRPTHETAGYGLPYSWPAPVPLFSRNQLWTSRELTVGRSSFGRIPGARNLRQTVYLSVSARS